MATRKTTRNKTPEPTLRHVWLAGLGLIAVARREAIGAANDAVGKLQAGYTRYLATAAGWRAGVGGQLSAGFVPETLKPRYGSRANLGVGFFLTLRPAPHMMGSATVDRGSGTSAP